MAAGVKLRKTACRHARLCTTTADDSRHWREFNAAYL